MPATPFPHPSVHTTTTVPSLACSNIRPRSLMYSVAGSAQSLAVIQSRHIKRQKITFGLPFMLRPLKAFQRCIPKWIHLKVLVSNCPADGRSGDLWLPCDGFMRILIYWCIKTFFAVKIYLQVLHQVAFTGPKWGLAILLCIANTHIAPSARLSYQTLSALFCHAVHIKKVSPLFWSKVLSWTVPQLVAE